GVGLFFMARSLLSKPVVTVPDVRKQALASAERILRNRGFDIGRITPRSDPNIAKGHVIDYDPKRAHDGDAINLVVSTGPQSAEVPTVVCRDEATARQELTNRGFKVKIVGPQAHADRGPTQ